MTLLDYFDILRRRWWLVPLPALLVVAITLATATPAVSPGYAVTMRFSAGLPPEAQSKDAYDYDRHYNWLASEYITRALSQASETGVFAQNISKRLAAQSIVVPVGAIRSEFTASYLKVIVTWGDPVQATAIAQATIDELSTNAQAYWPQLSGSDAAPVRLLDSPVALPIPPALRSRFDLPVRLLLGLAAGVLAVFAWHFLDPLVRRNRDIEQLGVSVFGEI